MFCQHCGTQNPDNSSCCSNCGAPLHGGNGQGPCCPNCGTPIPNGVQYCPNCGKPLNANQPPIGQNPSAFTRSIPLCIVLSIVTCGIYGLYWLYSLANDLNNASAEQNPTSGGMVVLISLVTCNFYLYYWMYKAGQQVVRAKQMRGLPADSNSSILYLILTFFGLGFISYALIQNELNQMA